MSNRYVHAEMLAAIWKLGAPDDRLPTSHGILDRALKETAERLPPELRDGLSFGITGVGLRCYELPSILLAAQEALLTTEPNPTYLSSMVTIDEGSAKQIVLSHGIPTKTAREVGRQLKDQVDRFKATMPLDIEDLVNV